MKRLRILHVGVALAGALLAALPWLTSSAYCSNKQCLLQ